MAAIIKKLALHRDVKDGHVVVYDEFMSGVMRESFPRISEWVEIEFPLLPSSTDEQLQEIERARQIAQQEYAKTVEKLDQRHAEIVGQVVGLTSVGYKQL